MLQRKHMESLRRWPMDMFEKFYEERLQEEKNKPVECLGMTFENDEKRREYFLKKLREKLKTGSCARSARTYLLDHMFRKFTHGHGAQNEKL